MERVKKERCNGRMSLTLSPPRGHACRCMGGGPGPNPIPNLERASVRSAPTPAPACSTAQDASKSLRSASVRLAVACGRPAPRRACTCRQFCARQHCVSLWPQHSAGLSVLVQ
jgi:hypothetical protein